MPKRSTAYRKDQIKMLNDQFEEYRHKRLTLRDASYYTCVRCTNSRYTKTYYVTIRVKAQKATIPLCINCIEGMKLFYESIGFHMEIKTNMEFAIYYEQPQEKEGENTDV